MDVKTIEILPDKIDKIYNVRIEVFGLQNWVDWLIQHTTRDISKKDILQAVENYETNYKW